MQRVSEKAIRELINEALDGGIEPTSLIDKTQEAFQGVFLKLCFEFYISTSYEIGIVFASLSDVP